MVKQLILKGLTYNVYDTRFCIGVCTRLDCQVETGWNHRLCKKIKKIMSVGKWHGGKGDALRSGFDHKAYAENFERIFKKHDKCGTEECCGKCDTASKPIINSKTK